MTDSRLEKRCNKCGVVKALEKFAKRTGGYRNKCKACASADHRAWYAKMNPEKKAEFIAKSQRWAKENPDGMKACRAKWRAENQEARRRDNGLNRRSKNWRLDRRAQPKWASKLAMDAIYARATHLTELTGVKHDVDHIVPMNSKVVCGLHVPENLQVIPSRENKLKWRHYTP